MYKIIPTKDIYHRSKNGVLFLLEYVFYKIYDISEYVSTHGEGLFTGYFHQLYSNHHFLEYFYCNCLEDTIVHIFAFSFSTISYYLYD